MDKCYVLKVIFRAHAFVESAEIITITPVPQQRPEYEVITLYWAKY